MRKHHSYLLLEMMFVIGFIVIAGALAIHLAQWSLRYMHATELADSRNAALDQCVSQLRRDVWSASSMQNPEAQSLLLRNAANLPITWGFAEDGLVARRQGKETQTWEAGAAGVSIMIDRASVELTFADTPQSRGGSVSLISEAKLLGAGAK
jgi:type II secretory pathway pseudopilin PulG